MVKKIILATLNFFTLLAFVPVSLVVFLFSWRARNGLLISRDQLLKCEVDDEMRILIAALIFAEDHRYHTHFGIDPIAILRAVVRYLTNGCLEGASTIEQQYVRTCTGHFEVSLVRKLEELSIAVWIALLLRKNDVAYSYLSYAYFGHGVYGFRRAIAVLNGEFNSSKARHGAAIVSLLKRPRPAIESENWKSKHQKRIEYVLERQSGCLGENHHKLE